MSKCTIEMEPPLEPSLDFPKNPLLCPICHDYFTEPCILSCYHTFCARCLRGREQDRRLICPFCRQPTLLKDGSVLPPPDTLMRQLIDIANSENPPCSNCDKRDRTNMYWCNTCGQALCSHCRDNTHRAKMFSTHDIIHMTKCSKEPKRCQQHGEQYIMFSPHQNTMLCVNCFRDAPTDVRTQCVDIETAHAQAAKRLERCQTTIMDLQTSVRDGIIALKGLMDELRRNMDGEKHTINTFCQGMQEAMAKTHAAMIMEVQRQFESKDRVYRSQLLVLGTVMPVLQLHLVLCTTFTAAANKYQFLELCPALVERLGAVGQLSQPVRALQGSSIKTNYRSEFQQCLEPWIGQAAVNQHQSEIAAASRMYDTAPPPTKKQQESLKAKLLQSPTSFSAHCRSFESQIRDLNHQFNSVKEKVSDLHRDISALRQAQIPPLSSRYELLMRDCAHLALSLDRQQAELDRMAAAFDLSWQEQLWRLRIEQEVFGCQRADVRTLRDQLRHLSELAAQLEPHIRSLHLPEGDEQVQALLEHFQALSQNPKLPRSRSKVLGQFFEKVAAKPERSKSAEKAPAPAAGKKQSLNIDRLEAHIKEKLHDMMCRRQSTKSEPEINTSSAPFAIPNASTIDGIPRARNLTYKKIGKSCDKLQTTGKKCVESEYQRIADATSAPPSKGTRSGPNSPKKKRGPPPAPPKRKVYPYSDGEETVLYARRDESGDSMSTSSYDGGGEGGGPDKTLVVVINRRNGAKGMTLAQKQRSWETFPPKRRHHLCRSKMAAGALRKADSFEGHEEAVKSLVAAVQETRRKPKGGSTGG